MARNSNKTNNHVGDKPRILEASGIVTMNGPFAKGGSSRMNHNPISLASDTLLININKS